MKRNQCSEYGCSSNNSGSVTILDPVKSGNFFRNRKSNLRFRRGRKSSIESFFVHFSKILLYILILKKRNL